MAADAIACEGTVIDEHRGIYRVEVSFGGKKRLVIARCSGRLIVHRIKIVPGDVVQLEVSPYDVTRGRIVYRGRREASGERPQIRG